MPKAYSEKERLFISSELRKAALESMLMNGVRKTTVDELVKKVQIPKGTFYLFYESKEMLLYDALMQKEAELHTQLSDKLIQIKDNFSVDSLTQLITEFYNIGFSIGLLPLMLSGEIDLLIRKLPDEVVAKHISSDDDYLSVFCELFPNINEQQLKDFSSAFRAIFFSAAYKREIGENYNNALKIMIKGIVIQMWQVAKND